jgi:trk system potassium uptake protein TrkH
MIPDKPRTYLNRENRFHLSSFLIVLRRTFFSERLLLVYFFSLALLTGTFLLNLPMATIAEGGLSFVDALFVATSAITVTGLMPVSTTVFTVFGKVIILFLIQVGGLGFITFTTLFLLVPGGRISIRNAQIVRNYFLSSVEYNPRRIMRDILLTTFGIELLGAIIIYFSFWSAGRPVTPFYALFHAVSAFCNAGISLSDDSIIAWHGASIAVITIALLVFAGGIGWVVLSDMGRWISARHRRQHALSLHSKITLYTSLGLVLLGVIFFFVISMVSGRNDNSWYDNLLGAFFHSVITRTGGFSYEAFEDMSFASQLVTVPLMFIGAGPGSTGGGIKVTTFFLILIVIFRDDFRYNSFKLGTHQISIDSFRRAMVFFIRALMLLFLFIGLVFVVESKANNVHVFFSIVFETISAFSTVGLSMGITPNLSPWGKVVMMCVMFSGKVGIFSLAIYVPNPKKERGYQLPEQEVLLG